jgi:DNA sulfur modification protein DndB
VVAECKAASKATQRSLQKDVNEFAALQRPIANALRRAFGADFKRKIIWMFVTQNICWSGPDLARAHEANIHPLQARELWYFEEMAKKVGRAAKYQFHAEFLGGKKIPALKDRRILATRTRLGGQTVYLFSARPIDILRIAFVNHRDLRDPLGAPTYQRMVQPRRLKKIGEFLDAGGYFPNTILLNFHRRPRFDRTSADDASDMQFGYLTLPDRYKSAWVVDGQHRLLGCTSAKSFDGLSNLFCLAYAELPLEEEAKLFVTINNEQKTVPKKLLAELDGELKWNSEDPHEQLAAIASRAIDLLNTESRGPFEDKVVSPNLKSSNEHPIDLPQFHQAIVASQLIGHVGPRTKKIVPGPCWDRDQKHTLERLVALLSWYFSLLRDANVDLWEGGKANKLCTNTGTAGHTRLLGGLIKYIEMRDGLSTTEFELDKLQEELLPLLQPVFDYIKRAPEEELRVKFTVPFGNSGPRHYFFLLVRIVRERLPDWVPPGYEEYIQQVSQSQVQRADQQVKWIQARVQRFVIERLREKLGDKFFDIGVPKTVYQKAHQKRSDDPPEDRMPVENYLDFLDLRKIVEDREVWPLFEGELSIPLRDERKGKSKSLTWMDQINEIRRISAHPHGRTYQPEDIELLKDIEKELRERLPAETNEFEFATVS